VTTPWIVVTGLDGSGKTTLVSSLAERLSAQKFRLPYHDFVRDCLARSGDGSPFGDPHTDRLLFALDARLANYFIRTSRSNAIRLVSQRGWMDNFIFGAVQGISYEQTEAMLRPAELERPTAHICLIAEPGVAFARLEGCVYRDKYETAEFIARQHIETTRFFDRVVHKDAALRSFCEIPTLLIDTTDRTHRQTCLDAMAFLDGLGNG
jgi:thymidylate kinase